MTCDDTISTGRDAWTQIERSNSFEAWKTVAAAVVIIRQMAMRQAGVNKPQGKRYAVAVNALLEEHGFRAMPYPTRTACCRLVDHLREIELWRGSLPDGEKLNHPQVLVRNWRRAFRPGRGIEPRKTTRRVVVSAKRDGFGKPINPGGDMVRRVGSALSPAVPPGTDIYKLSAIAIRAVLSDPDLIGLLNEAPPNHTRRTAVDAELHA